MAVAGLTLLPEVLAEAHVDGTVTGGPVLAVAAGVTRVLALPSVDRFLHRFVPRLTAEPRP